MRVLSVGNMYPPASIGGYELIWRSWVRHMRARGHHVRVLTSDHRAGERAEEGEDTDVHRELAMYWRDHEFPRLSLRARLRLERANHGTLLRHVAEFAPDAVAWWAMGGMSMSLLERVRRDGLPAVGVVCDDWLLYGPSVDAWTRLFRRLPRRLDDMLGDAACVPVRPRLGDAASWIFLSDTLRNRAQAAGVASPEARVCKRGPDADLFRPAPAHDWRWRLLYLGRIDPRKGIATAIEALTRLPSTARLTVAGGGDERHRDELLRLAERLGVSDRVTWSSSRREEVPVVLAAADVVLFPVLWEEPWGLVPLEAMAVGTPVVATGRGGSGEYLRDGDNCLLHPAGDPAALAAAVERLAAEPELRARLREAGLATARRYGEREFNEAVEAALGEAVAQSDLRQRKAT